MTVAPARYLTGRPYQLLHEVVSSAVKAKNTAYAERANLVAALSKVYPSHLARHEDSDVAWHDEWRNIVCVHLPSGHAAWHIHDTDWHLFLHLTPDEPVCGGWDGCTFEEKYKRLGDLEKDWRE